eukprot:TRINITY_DN704_c0_g1_i1.p4 TRINITY_DN704_c0_g1~~TRINITY_DN704_c0_g1_i1.p4  ORF type:complete len:143 (-),score=44.46 TRINITY_DN704_c0_g1_i1:939-1367(-)
MFHHQPVAQQRAGGELTGAAVGIARGAVPEARRQLLRRQHERVSASDPDVVSPPEAKLRKQAPLPLRTVSSGNSPSPLLATPLQSPTTPPLRVVPAHVSPPVYDVAACVPAPPEEPSLCPLLPPLLGILLRHVLQQQQSGSL